MQDAMVMVVATNAQPSRCSNVSQTAAMAAMTASSSIRLRKNAVPAVTCVQTMKPMTKAPVNGATTRATRPERASISPVVFRHRNVAPCSRHTRTSVTPAKTAYGCSRSQNEPVKFWLESIGSPCSRSASAMPISSGLSRLPIVSSQSQVCRQPVASRLPRYSNATPRMISVPSSSASARYMPENIVAYQPGNAANMAAPAQISHTSLPSHSGPIVLMAARRPESLLAMTPCSMPTPKSNPSRMKNPVHKIAMTMNQNGTSALIVASVLDRRDGFVRVHGGWRWRQLLARVLQHQEEIDGAERGIQRDEADQADP